MKKILTFAFAVFIGMSFCGCATKNAHQDLTGQAIQFSEEKQADPLPSWSGSQLKTDIVAYVKDVTDAKSPNFIPVEDRVAVFDNDGTLWAEKPVVQLIYINEKLLEKIKKEPSLKNKEPYKSILSGDAAALEKMDVKEIFKVIAEVLTGMTAEEFEKDSARFFETGKYPKFGVSFDKIVYKPQKELILFLQANAFQVYICSGGDTDFIRMISKEYYNIPEENVMGSYFESKYDYSSNRITRQPKILTNNDKEQKPVSIEQRIGKRPVFACGNVGNSGDISMLFYSQGSRYKSFQMLVNHDDAQREFQYGEKDNASLNAAQLHKWNVISMQNDWKEIF